MFGHLRSPALLSALLVLATIARIGFSYRHTSQAFDEPYHISAGIEFLDRRTYELDPVHPTLSRLAIALPLFAAGERYPNISPSDPDKNYLSVIGNHILHDSGHFRRNLTLARIGVLPFFVLGALVVFLWACRIGNERSALLAVFLYATIPTILAFSSIAYTDIVAASTQAAALFAFSLWIQSPTRAHTFWLGLSLGFAFLAKLTSVLFLPAATVCMLLIWFLGTKEKPEFNLRRRSLQVLGALALSALIVWGGYFFSLQPLQQATGITPNALPSFQHFPAVARQAIRQLVIENPRLPAPELLNGVAQAWVLNKSTSPSYLFGRVKNGGWWYFYLCALSLKLPLPLLLLFAIGLFLLLRGTKRVEELLPLAGLLGILLVTTQVSYQVGIRHILVCLPLIAIVTATGLKGWLDTLFRPSVPALVLLALVLWQIGESVMSQGDFLAYFNEVANEVSGDDPSKLLVTGCDLDCGQDMDKLARELQSRQINRVTLAVWTTADLDRSGLPAYDILQPGKDLEGWVAVSCRAIRTGDSVHQTLPPHTFDWLEHQTPVAHIGRTIALYHIGSEHEPPLSARKAAP